jgi:hypothetical protein
LLSYLVVFDGRDLRVCDLLYDTMMMVVRELPAHVVSAGGQRPVPDIPIPVCAPLAVAAVQNCSPRSPTRRPTEKPRQGLRGAAPAYRHGLWRSVKYEEVYLRAYDSVGEARTSIVRYLDFYNCGRPHSSLDGTTPDQAYFAPLPIRMAA